MLRKAIVPLAALALVLAACNTPLALLVTSLSPADGAVDVPVDSAITATFNVAIDPATVDGSFELASNGEAVDGVVAYDPATRTATFTPAADLAYDTTYVATVDGSVATTTGTTLGGDASWSFTTEAAPIPDDAIGGLLLAPAAPGILVGGTVDLEPSFSGVVGSPSLALDWESDDETVATVANGTVTGVAVGVTTITATSVAFPGVSASASVTVSDVPTVAAVVVNPATVQNLIVGLTAQLTAQVTAAGGADESVTWSSDAESVATVDDTGLVTAVGAGTATITATSDFDAAVSGAATVSVVTPLDAGAYPSGAAAATIVDTALTDLTVAVSGGVAPYAFATSSTLPAGVSLDPATGTIAGTPTETGTFAGTVVVTDASNQSDAVAFELVVVDVLSVTTFLDATEPAGTTIEPLQVVTTGGLAPFTFTLVPVEPFPAPNGPLAPGLTLGEVTGTLTGTLSQAGFFSSVILTTDALGQTAETLVEIDVSLVLIYAGSPYDYIRGCGGNGTIAFCPANDEPLGNQGSNSAITPFADIQVIGGVGPYAFSMARVGGGNTSGWAISPTRGVIFRSDTGTVGGFSNNGNTRNGDRSYLVTVFDDATGETATFTVAFVEIPAP
jgi:hypothetical protein